MGLKDFHHCKLKIYYCEQLLNRINGSTVNESRDINFEVQLLNNKYHGLRIRKIPFLGDVLFIQILRGRDVIIPNGDTVLERYDRIMVSGSQEYIEELRQEFELT